MNKLDTFNKQNSKDDSEYDASGSIRPDKIEEAILQATWAYYHDGLNQTAIAKKLNLSRASVVNYLQEARRRKYVRITLDPEIFKQHQLADLLKTRFELEAVSIAPTAGKLTLDRVSRMTAEWLAELLRPGDVLGVAWGENVHRVAELTPRVAISGLTVVQLVGSGPAASGFTAEVCTSIMALRFSAKCINLHVPMLVSKPGLAKNLKAEPIVKAQFDAIERCNAVIFACGTCDTDSHLARTGLLSAEVLSQNIEKGATGVICGQLIDEFGKPMRNEVEKRMLSVSLAQMKSKKLKLMVGSGEDRVKPMLAAIRGGFVTHLSTCAETAELLLAAAKD